MACTRRTMLTGGTAMVGGTMLRAATQAAPAPLKDVAAARGMRFGSAIAADNLGNRRGALLTREASILVAENEFKFGSVRPTEDEFRFATADRIAAFAARHGIALRGHNLYWNVAKYTPAWVSARSYGAQPATGFAQMLETHVAAMGRRYPQAVSWDVVNETIDPDTGVMRDTIATRLMGSQLMDAAFAAARRHAPHAQLVYNDYMGWDPTDEKHRTGVLRLLEGMRKRDVPCDALGLQSHLHVPGEPPAAELPKRAAVWRAFLREVDGMGYTMLVTELDVDDRAAPTDRVVRDRTVAEIARVYLEETLAVPSVSDVLVWGLDNGASWLQGFLPRTDGTPQRCCPFDDHLKPTAFHDAIMQAIAAAPPRKV